jgi:hypothetical protein
MLRELPELRELPLDPASAVPATIRPIARAAALRRNRLIVDSFAASQRLFLFPASGSFVPKTPSLKAAAVPRKRDAANDNDANHYKIIT